MDDKLKSVVFYCLKQWSIDKKIFLDNNSVNNIPCKIF